MPVVRFLLQVIRFLIAMYFVTFLHELGHAIPGLILTDYNANIALGPFDSRPARHTLRLGRLLIHWHGFGFFMGRVDFGGNEFTKKQASWVIAGGPLMSLVLFFVFLFAGQYTLNVGALSSFLLYVAKMFLIQFFITGIPWRYPAFFGDYNGMASDGLNLWHLLRGKGIYSVRK